VKFDLPYPGYIDPVATGHWNFNFTASGKTITAWGVDWNKTLAAKATSNSIGFCAFKQ
jgi:cellulase/cellobiase CelA1